MFAPALRRDKNTISASCHQIRGGWTVAKPASDEKSHAAQCQYAVNSPLEERSDTLCLDDLDTAVDHVLVVAESEA